MQSHPHEGPSRSHPTSLPSVLGLWDIVSIVVGGVIGSGIFIVPAAIASELSSPVLFLGVWVAGGILSFFGALAFAKLAAAKLVAAAMMAGLVAVNYVGVRRGANLQNVLTAIKFAALVGICGFVFLFVDGETSHFGTPALDPPSWSLAGNFGVAMVAVLWAYKGWDGASYSTGETRDPARNLP